MSNEAKQSTTFWVGISLAIAAIFLVAFFYRDWASKQKTVVLSGLPSPIKVPYEATPALACGIGCEWRASGDNIWTLVDNSCVVARIFPSNSYPGYFDVSDGYGIRHQISEWGKIDKAKEAAEAIAKKRAGPCYQVSTTPPPAP